MDIKESNSSRYWGMKEDTYCMLMHLSQLLNFASGIGIIIPIVMWAMNRDDSAMIDRQGKMVINWIISLVIYLAASFILTFIFVGMLGFIVFGFLSVLFPIIGAVKAMNGQEWKYPMTISFLK